MNPRISVVVPTRDRAGSLRRCLEALASQTVVDELEIIVVDDGSASGDDVAKAVAEYARTRLVRLEGRGPGAARNAGAAIANGSVLCFTDDDCVPEPQWAESLLAALDEGVEAAAGTTLSSAGPIAVASELVAHAPGSLPLARRAELAFAPSNNLACRRSVFEEIAFDESFPDAAGEDRDWCARLTAAGGALRAQPAARVRHVQDLTFGRFIAQQIRYGRGAFRFHRAGPDTRPFESRGFYARLIGQSFARGFRVGLLVTVAQVATTIGLVLEWGRCAAFRGRSARGGVG